MRIDSSGNLSLATATSLDFNVADFAQIRFKESGAITIDSDNNQSSRNFQIKDGSGSSLLTVLDTGDATFTGNVGIGVTVPTNSPNYNTLDIRGTTGGQILLGRSGFDFFIYSTSASSHLGVVTGQDLVFHTNSSGTTNERMRITAGGDILDAVDAISDITGASQNGAAFHTTFGCKISSRNTTSGASHLIFYNPNGIVGNIETGGSATTYNTSSDYRLKEDLKDFKGLDMVSQIPVYDFKWKVDESRSYGVMAHELAEVLPQSVSGKKDSLNEDGSIKPQGVDYSKIVPLLVKSIQELKAEIETLKTQINK